METLHDDPRLPKVFLSSTSQFANERTQLADALRREPFNVFDYREETARGVSPEKHCRRMIRDSEIFCLILGESYGSSYPGRGESIVEWEYDVALHSRGVDVEPHIKQPRGATDPRQEQFIGRVQDFRGGKWCNMFSTPEQLIGNAVASARKYRTERLRFQSAEDERLQRAKDVSVIACTLLAVLALCGAVVWGVVNGLPAERLLLPAGMGLLTPAALLPLLRMKLTKGAVT
jgi:hypothetical protein